MGNEQLHSVRIGYPDTNSPLSMVWHSVTDFETYTPLDFREITTSPDAKDELLIFARAATRKVLRERETVLTDEQPVPNIQRVASFLGGLNIEPLGSIAYTEKLVIENTEIKSIGLTLPGRRQAFVVGDNVGKPEELPEELRYAVNARLDRQTAIEAAAVHELIHLAGVLDIGYFIPSYTSGGDRSIEITVANGGMLDWPVNDHMPDPYDNDTFIDDEGH